MTAKGLTLLALVAGLGSGPANAAPDAPEIKQSKQVDAMTISGDFRLRDEFFWYTDSNQDPLFVKNTIPADYNRERFRFRVKDEYKLHDDLTVVAGLASGAGQAVSTNQTFGTTDSQPPIWIDMVYAFWAPGFLGDNGSMMIQGGKMANPVWRLYTSDLVYDPDLNPYGYAESASYLIEDVGTVFGTLFQHVVDNNKNAVTLPGPELDQDPWEMVEQLGVEVPLPMATRIKVAAADHFWKNIHDGTLHQNPVQTGNTRNAGGTLLDEYNVGEVTGQLSTILPNPFMNQSIPLAFQGTVIKNFAARGPDFQGWIAGTFYDGPKKGNSPFKGFSGNGYQIGAVLGKVAAPGSWEIAYYWKRVQYDATVADVADSDFGDPNGGLNRKGSIAWIGYTPNGFITFQLKAYQTWILDQQYVVVNKGMQNINLANNIDRFQADVVVKF